MKMFNRASFLINLIKAKIQNKYIPLTVIYNITNRCNARCKYCYLEYYKRHRFEPTKEQIFAVIDELKKMGNKRISLGGGEPLIRQDIGEIIDYIKYNELACVINSNGILVPKKINLLKKIDTLCISLDGEEKIHDLYRGNGSFKNVLRAIKYARESGLSVNTNTVLNKSNLRSIDYILELAKIYNFSVEFNLLIGYLPDNSRPNLKAENKDLRKAINKIIYYKRKGYPILMSEKAYRYALSWPDYNIEEIKNNKPNFKHLKCFAGKYFCAIDTNGKVYACPHLIGKVGAISCYKDGFANAFDNSLIHNCKSCYQIYHNEFNLLFNFDFSVILNHIKNTLRLNNL
ncbi:radical SAM/SPASM domain-containing protein [Patescibacteria group bacterium]